MEFKGSKTEFNGDYLCECVKEFCENTYIDNIDSITGCKLTDYLVWQYFMSVSYPIHIDIDGIRTHNNQPERSKREDAECLKHKMINHSSRFDGHALNVWNRSINMLKCTCDAVL